MLLTSSAAQNIIGPGPTDLITEKSMSYSLESFNSSSYYATGRNVDEVMLNDPGVELIAQYYKEKYSANITIIPTLDLKVGIPLDHLTRIKDHIALARKQPGEYRVAFIVGITHSTPIIYMKENNKEAVLIAGTKGAKLSDKDLAALQVSPEVPIYMVQNPRQTDFVSCHTDAVIFGKDATGKNSEQHYLVPNLLSRLEARSINAEHYKIAMLPDELLKTSQLPAFVKEHKEQEDIQVHQHKNKPETLNAFRARYTKPVFINEKKDEIMFQGKFQTSNDFLEKYRGDDNFTEKNFNNYLREKGLKFIDIIEIQFYVNELEKAAGQKLTSVERENFVVGAKEAFKSNTDLDNPRLHTWAIQFLNDRLTSATSLKCASNQ